MRFPNTIVKGRTSSLVTVYKLSKVISLNILNYG